MFLTFSKIIGYILKPFSAFYLEFSIQLFIFSLFSFDQKFQLSSDVKNYIKLSTPTFSFCSENSLTTVLITFYRVSFIFSANTSENFNRFLLATSSFFYKYKNIILFK